MYSSPQKLEKTPSLSVNIHFMQVHISAISY